MGNRDGNMYRETGRDGDRDKMRIERERERREYD